MCEPGTLGLGVGRLVYSVISPLPACLKCALIVKELIRTHEIHQRMGDHVSVSHGGRTFNATNVRNELLEEAGWTLVGLVPVFSLINQYRNYQTELAHEKTGTRMCSVKSHDSKYEQYVYEFGRLAFGEGFVTISYIVNELEVEERKSKQFTGMVLQILSNTFREQ